MEIIYGISVVLIVWLFALPLRWAKKNIVVPIKWIEVNIKIITKYLRSKNGNDEFWQNEVQNENLKLEVKEKLGD